MSDDFSKSLSGLPGITVGGPDPQSGLPMGIHFSSAGLVQTSPSLWHPPQVLSGTVVSGAFSSGQISLWHLGSGAIQSGYIAGGPVHLASGAITSGYIGGHYPTHLPCTGCDGETGSVLASDSTFLSVRGTYNGPIDYYCFKCAGYRPDLRRFESREDWIRESLASRFGPHMPCWALADYLEEQGRDVEARWLRTERSGR